METVTAMNKIMFRILAFYLSISNVTNTIDIVRGGACLFLICICLSEYIPQWSHIQELWYLHITYGHGLMALQYVM